MPDGRTSTRHLQCIDSLKAFLESSQGSPQACDRFLLVEDISQPLVEILGTAFNCDPSFFESFLPLEYHKGGTCGSVLGSRRNHRLPSDTVYNSYLSIPFYRQSSYRFYAAQRKLTAMPRDHIWELGSGEENVAYAWLEEFRTGK